MRERAVYIAALGDDADTTRLPEVWLQGHPDVEYFGNPWPDGELVSTSAQKMREKPKIASQGAAHKFLVVSLRSAVKGLAPQTRNSDPAQAEFASSARMIFVELASGL